MNFLVYNLLLLAASFPAIIVFSVVLMAIVSPLTLFSRSNDPPQVVAIIILGLSGLFQIYFWGLWSAFCVAMTYKYTAKPDVTWDWLYFVFGFFWCTALIGWLSYKEQQTSGSIEESRGVRSGTTLYKLVAIIASIVFAIWPTLMSAPSGWALGLVGLSGHFE